MPCSRAKRTWLVLICESGMEMMERSVCCARALMRDVLPVPGGPCSSSPSLWPYPGMAYCRREGQAGISEGHVHGGHAEGLHPKQELNVLGWAFWGL